MANPFNPNQPVQPPPNVVRNIGQPNLGIGAGPRGVVQGGPGSDTLQMKHLRAAVNGLVVHVNGLLQNQNDPDAAAGKVVMDLIRQITKAGANHQNQAVAQAFAVLLPNFPRSNPPTRAQIQRLRGPLATFDGVVRAN